MGPLNRHTYELNKFKKHAMLILHNHAYDGSNSTAEHLRETFQKFRFEVELYHNMTGVKDVKNILEKFFARDFNNYGCAFVVVISPTRADGSFGTQDSYFTDDDVLKYFQRDFCPTLNNKPKVFISEANNLNVARLGVMDYRRNIDILELRMAINIEKTSRRTLLSILCEGLNKYAGLLNFTDIVNLTSNKNFDVVHNFHNQITTISRVNTLRKQLWLCTARPCTPVRPHHTHTPVKRNMMSVSSESTEVTIEEKLMKENPYMALCTV